MTKYVRRVNVDYTDPRANCFSNTDVSDGTQTTIALLDSNIRSDLLILLTTPPSSSSKR